MSMTIGAVAEAAGVNVATVRYYERRGIIAEPRRTESGYRQYDEPAVTRLRFIRRAQERREGGRGDMKKDRTTMVLGAGGVSAAVASALCCLGPLLAVNGVCHGGPGGRATDRGSDGGGVPIPGRYRVHHV